MLRLLLQFVSHSKSSDLAYRIMSFYVKDIQSSDSNILIHFQGK
jgi:hypothetical protein